jgi:hypothetical protein
MIYFKNLILIASKPVAATAENHQTPVTTATPEVLLSYLGRKLTFTL